MSPREAGAAATAELAADHAAAEWLPVRVSDWRLRRLRDRHYSTRNPGGATVGAPGRRLALVTFEGTAERHRGPLDPPEVAP